VNVLAVPQARDIAGKLAGNILNVLGMDWVGTSQVHCPFPCNVLAVYQLSILALVPSVRCIVGYVVKEVEILAHGASEDSVASLSVGNCATAISEFDTTSSFVKS